MFEVGDKIVCIDSGLRHTEDAFGVTDEMFDMVEEKRVYTIRTVKEDSGLIRLEEDSRDLYNDGWSFSYKDFESASVIKYNK